MLIPMLMVTVKQWLCQFWQLSNLAFCVLCLSDNLSSSISGSDSESESEDNGFPGDDMLSDVGPIGKPYLNTAIAQETPDASHCHLSSNKRNYPKLFLKNNNGELISVYKCILYHKKVSRSNSFCMMLNSLLPLLKHISCPMKTK